MPYVLALEGFVGGRWVDWLTVISTDFRMIQLHPESVSEEKQGCQEHCEELSLFSHVSDCLPWFPQLQSEGTKPSFALRMLKGEYSGVVGRFLRRPRPQMMHWECCVTWTGTCDQNFFSVTSNWIITPSWWNRRTVGLGPWDLTMMFINGLNFGQYFLFSMPWNLLHCLFLDMSRILTLASDQQHILKSICPRGLRGSLSLCCSGCTIPELKKKIRHQMFVFVLWVIIPSHHNLCLVSWLSA